MNATSAEAKMHTLQKYYYNRILDIKTSLDDLAFHHHLAKILMK